MDNALFDKLLTAAVKSGVSDVHIKVGAPFMVRDGGELAPITEEPLTPDDVLMIVARLLDKHWPKQGITDPSAQISRVTEIDTSFSLAGVSRFRVNVHRQRGSLAVVMRIIPASVPSIDELMLPAILKNIALIPRGLALVTGQTGSGKSTTLAALLNHVNKMHRKKIITIEDPIEFLIRDELSAVTQREVGSDTESFSKALRAALRQDPDVIMVGEMRDRETIEIALKAAETGHAVFSTVHTSDAESTILRLLGVFEGSEQAAVRMRVADALKAVISQRLVKRKDEDGRVAALEVMRMTESIRERILNSDERGFHDLIEQGWNPYRMQSFDRYLTELVKKDLISVETGLAAATSPTNFKRNLTFDEN